MTKPCILIFPLTYLGNQIPGGRFVVRAGEKLKAFLELEAAIRTVAAISSEAIR
jgi:hypothetical protein